MTYAPVRCIVSKQWNNGPYSTVDGRRLIAVANTLRALVLGGALNCLRGRYQHSPIQSTVRATRVVK